MSFSKSEFIGALLSSDVQLIKKFLNQAVNWYFMPLDNRAALCIHIAAEANQIDMVQFLTRNEPRLVLRQDGNHLTALQYAAKEGHDKIVQYLLTSGFEFPSQLVYASKPTEEKSALDYAIEANHVECIRLLKIYWLREALGTGDVPCIKAKLLDLALDPSVFLGMYPPLHFAFIKEEFDLVYCLLEKNKNLIHLKDKRGQTLLLWAAAKGHLPLLQFLIAEGADLQVATQSQESTPFHQTPLYWAKKGGHTECVEILQKAHYDEFQKKINLTKRHYSRLEFLKSLSTEACREGHVAVVNHFMEKIPEGLGNGHEPWIHLMIYSGHVELVQLALTKEPDSLNKANKAGLSPLHAAVLAGEDDIVQFLIDKNAEFDTNLLKTSIGLGYYCIANLLLLKWMENDISVDPILWIQSTDQALDLIHRNPSFLDKILQNETLQPLLQPSNSIFSDSKYLGFYQVANKRRQSVYWEINKESKTLALFKNEAHLSVTNSSLVRQFRSNTGQSLIVKSLAKMIATDTIDIQEEKINTETQLASEAYGEGKRQVFHFRSASRSEKKYNFRSLMPVAQGKSLKQWATNRICDAVLAKILVSITQELQRIHELGIIHGDIHNENVLIRMEASQESKIVVQFIDFGFSYKTNVSSIKTLKFENYARRWFPPERLQNEALKPCRSQDVYSLGVYFDTVLDVLPNRQLFLQQFPCIDTFIQKAHSPIPNERPQLEEFCQLLSVAVEEKQILGFS